MSRYPFLLIQPERSEPLKSKEHLKKRPFSDMDHSFAADAKRFVPGNKLATAINTAGTDIPDSSATSLAAWPSTAVIQNARQVLSWNWPRTRSAAYLAMYSLG